MLVTIMCCNGWSSGAGDYIMVTIILLWLERVVLVTIMGIWLLLPCWRLSDVTVTIMFAMAGACRAGDYHECIGWSCRAGDYQ